MRVEEGYEPGLEEDSNTGGTNDDQTFEYDDEDDFDDEDEDFDDEPEGGHENNELESVKEKLAEMERANQELRRKIELKTQDSSAEKPKTEAELREWYKKDPVACMRYVNQLDTQASTAQIQSHLEKQKYDEEARTKYPIKDPNFKKELESQFADLLQSGANPDGPKTLLKACQMTAAVLGISKKKAKTTRTNRKSADSVVMSGQPKSKGGGGNVKLPRSLQNQFDLYASRYGLESEKTKKYREKIVSEYKANRRRSR